MVDDLKLSQSSASSGPREATPARGLLGRFATHFADSPVSFDVVLPNGTLQHFGPDAASFHVTLKNARALGPSPASMKAASAMPISPATSTSRATC